MKMKSVVASFDSLQEAQTVVRELERAGVPPHDISIIANNARGDYRIHDERALVSTDDTAGTTGSNVFGGAATGGVIGGATGLLVGAIALVLPGVGPIVAAGPIAAALAGAGVGAVAGGLIGGLTTLGVAENDAHLFAEAVRRGGAVVTVRADETTAERAADIMRRHGAVDMERRAESWRSEGWSGRYEPTAAAFTIDEPEQETTRSGRIKPESDIGATTGLYGTLGEGDAQQDWGAHEPHFRLDWESNYQSDGLYDDFLPAYRYGFETWNNPRFSGRDWDAIEPELRAEWERNRPGHEWRVYRDAVRTGWLQASSSVEPASGAPRR
ncbi:MAG TPA: general stress protein [Burkholderiaceae bacterium]|nr:general stress protein [Burkholderiaceae bacterium]